MEAKGFIFISSHKNPIIGGLVRRWENKNSYYVSLIVVLFFLLFIDWVSNAINKILVVPLMSTINQSNLKIDLICIALIIATQVLFFWKAWKKIKISPFAESIIFCISFIYIFWRVIENDRFQFVPFKIHQIKLLFLADVLLAPLVGIILYYIIRYFQYDNTKRDHNTNGFFIDSPVVLNDTNDHLSRRFHVKRLRDLIVSTDTPNHSFAIGIIGQWGSGKTTFLNSLAQELHGKKDLVIIQFNPWISNSPEGIASIFFSDLSKALSKYDESLRSELLSYATELLQTVENVNISPIKTFLSFFEEDKRSTIKYEKINRSIQRLKMKIIVLIDDVDRLAKNEVVEVLRIIRNTANFGNVFFLVAFDRVYVKKSIDEMLVANMNVEYLEKIFHLEYYLPLNPVNNIYQISLFTELKKVVNESNIKVIDSLINPEGNLFRIEVSPPINYYIRSFRDIKRFMNIFLLNYKDVENNVYLPDYISICLLRLRYPELYYILYEYRNVFFFEVAAAGIFEVGEGKLYSQYDKSDQKSIEDTKLYKFLSERKEAVGMTLTEIKNAVELVFSIFPPKNNIGTLTKERSLYNKHLSVTLYESFNRYFDFSMEGRLDQKEFMEIMNKSEKEIEQKFMEWNKSRAINTDLALKLENYVPENKEMFEKHINSILFYANLSVPENKFYTNMYNAESFYSKLGGACNQFNRVISGFYDGNKESFKSYFRNIYLKNIEFQGWGFLQEFSKTLISEYNDNFCFSHEELKDLVKERFILVVDAAERISTEILRYYINSLRLFQNPEINDGPLNIVDRSIETSEKLKPLVLSNVVELLNRNIYKDGRTGKYKLDDYPIYIFGSESAFDNILQERADDPSVGEYLIFCQEYKAKKTPIHFEFKHLRVNE